VRTVVSIAARQLSASLDSLTPRRSSAHTTRR
jgi:hypothetical protein